MNEHQNPPSQGEEPLGARPTDPEGDSKRRPNDAAARLAGAIWPTDFDRGDQRATAPASDRGSNAETQDLPSAPSTHQEEDGADLVAAEPGDTEPNPASPSEAEHDTGPFECGATTAPPVAGDPATITAVSFDLDPQFESPESTLLPGITDRTGGFPQVAGYELLEVLGAGGMGIVYKARQPRLARFVALKMIRSGAGARREDIVRFEAEAQAVAAIDHPNIVRIFEIGEHAGQPYISLEFVAGGSLSKKIAGKPQEVADAARITEVLARAMQVAHRFGIIHRDLKPANVLLAADGTPKITDFGLAKRLESDSGETRRGSILGTPSYMAPEQAKGETHLVGPAADQYALGAIFYELLTGRPPFQGTSVLDTLDQVRTKEPVPPSQLQPKVPRDAETICLKCLEKEPARRYTDVTELAEDLRRFQAREPIHARPVSEFERFWRWCLRNQRVAVLGALLAAMGFAVMVGSSVAAVKFNRQNRSLTAFNTALGKANVALGEANTVAEQRRLEAVRKQQLAEAERKRAVTAARAANQQNRNVVEAQRELIRLLEQKLRYVPELQAERQQMLAKAVESLEAAIKAMTDLRREVEWDPKDEALNWQSLAAAHFRLGLLKLSQNQFREAMAQFRQSDAITERLARNAPSDQGAQIRWARTQRQLGHVAVQHLGDTELGTRHFQTALEINRGLLAKEPDNDIFKTELANTLGQQAGVEQQLGHLKEAVEIYKQEVAVRQSFTPKQASETETRRQLAGQYERLGELSLRLGDINEGRRFYDLCQSIRKDVVATQPTFWPFIYDVARSFNDTGFLLLIHEHDPRGARDAFRNALQLIQQRSTTDPTNVETKAQLAETLYYEATAALYSGDTAGAALGYRHCLEIRQALATDPNVKMKQVDLIVALARCGKHAEAAELAKSLVATPPKNEILYFHAACGYALAAGAPGIDDKLIRQYTDKAIACLHNGKEHGWADIGTLQTEPDLEYIREDPAFQALLRDFKRRGGTRP